MKIFTFTKSFVVAGENEDKARENFQLGINEEGYLFAAMLDAEGWFQKELTEEQAKTLGISFKEEK